MFAFKNRYFLIIESIKDIDLKNIKKRDKFSIIYRNNNKTENITDLSRFRKKCSLRSVKFYVANNLKLSVLLKADGIYLSAFNNSLKYLFLKKYNFEIIGSAHNRKEIFMKTKQGCKFILFSKLFLVSYNKKASYLGITKFNKFLNDNNNLIPLGGINVSKLNFLKNINCEGIALLSAIKKPTKIFSRLF